MNKSWYDTKEGASTMGAPSCFCRIPLLTFRLFTPWSVAELTSLDSLLFQASILRSSLFTLPQAILSFTTFHSGQVYLRNEKHSSQGIFMAQSFGEFKKRPKCCPCFYAKKLWYWLFPKQKISVISKFFINFAEWKSIWKKTVLAEWYMRNWRACNVTHMEFLRMSYGFPTGVLRVFYGYNP